MTAAIGCGRRTFVEGTWHTELARLAETPAKPREWLPLKRFQRRPSNHAWQQ
jgi:hypothetical protein